MRCVREKKKYNVLFFFFFYVLIDRMSGEVLFGFVCIVCIVSIVVF